MRCVSDYACTSYVVVGTHRTAAPGGARGEERRREGSNSTSKKAVVSNGTIARLLKATAFVVWDTTELSLLALGLFDPKRVSAQPIFVVTISASAVAPYLSLEGLRRKKRRRVWHIK